MNSSIRDALSGSSAASKSQWRSLRTSSGQQVGNLHAEAWRTSTPPCCESVGTALKSKHADGWSSLFIYEGFPTVCDGQ